MRLVVVALTCLIAVVDAQLTIANLTYIGVGECRYGNATVVQGYKAKNPLSTYDCLYYCENWEPCTGFTVKWKNASRRMACFIHGDRLQYPWGDYYNSGFKLFPEFIPDDDIPYNISYSKSEEDRTVCYSMQDTSRKCNATFANGTTGVCIFPYLDENSQPMVSCDQWDRCAVAVEGLNNNVVEYGNCSCPPQDLEPTHSPTQHTDEPAEMVEIPDRGLSTLSLIIIVSSLFCTVVSLTTLTMLVRHQRHIDKIKTGFLLNQQGSSTNSLLGGYRSKCPSWGEQEEEKVTQVLLKYIKSRFFSVSEIGHYSSMIGI
eukprot:TRINITY_DN16631_c0_g2_i2.p1 TRINITY_DN16631_c0_g2~~TRINITY_DN16631_c0_g2_i2.p1  ORF type:complete len:316 (+),score=30.73 TRINITY_DN16631_c0_g2_i2:84-1031(+)